MIHGTKKVKFKNGQDSNTMIMRKLMYNFLRFSHVKTTERKAKALKSYLDRVLSKTKEQTESNKNYLLRYFHQKQIIELLFGQVGPAIAKISGGYVKIVRLNQRINDGSMMVEVQWAHPVVLDWGDKKEKKVKEVASKKDAKVETKKPVKKSPKEAKKE